MARSEPVPPIWARWRVEATGKVRVVATYAEGGGFAQRELSFPSLDAAADALGASFREVADKVMAAGLRAGRWRP